MVEPLGRLLEITMAVYAVRVFCNERAQVHSIEIDLEVPADEDRIDEHELSEIAALVVETAAKCPYTGRRSDSAKKSSGLSRTHAIAVKGPKRARASLSLPE
jgi:hypothetical protein